MPLFKLGVAPWDRPALEASEAHCYLCGVNDDALDGRVVHDLAGEGVAAHLIIRREAGKVVVVEGVLGGLSVGDKRFPVELHEAIEVAALKESLGAYMGVIVQFESEAQLHCRLAIGLDNGAKRIVLAELVAVPNHTAK